MSIPDAPAALAYAAPAEPGHAVRQMRLILGWAALAYAAASLLWMAVRWLASSGLLSTSFRFASGGGAILATALQSASLIVVFIAGIEVVRRGGGGLLFLRWASLADVGLALAFAALQVYYIADGLGGAAKPGDLLFHASGTLTSLFRVPALVCIMTFPLRAATQNHVGRSISNSAVASR